MKPEEGSTETYFISSKSINIYFNIYCILAYFIYNELYFFLRANRENEIPKM